MRIIGGEHGGRRIEVPGGRSTRPMLDRVREAVFSTVAPWIPGARVLDLFAGSGSLGLEALSRGAAHARFVERDARALALLRANAASLALLERCEALQGDALSPATWGAEPLDLVFLDPPYALLEEPGGLRLVLDTLAALVEGRLAPDGVVVLHVPRHRLSEQAFGAELVVRERAYGTSSIWYAGPAGAEEAT
jgi:16S rRNA (guanine966-N2)-methyltransferase